jgi:hypothetical protein
MKGLGHPYRLLRDMMDDVKIVLSFLCGLYHGLESLSLMGRIERLHNAVLGKVPTKTSLKAGVKSLLEPSTHAHGEIALAGEGPRCTHPLLEVCLNHAGHLIPIAV